MTYQHYLRCAILLVGIFMPANGVTSVDPLKTVPNRIPPTVIIEEMLVDGRLY